MKMHTPGYSGFTIVELIIVIVVVALLVSVAVVAYQGIQENAADAAVQADLRQAASQLKADREYNGEYSSSLINVDNGRGLSHSTGTAYHYTATEDQYCLEGSSAQSSDTYRITSNTGSAVTGKCNNF